MNFEYSLKKFNLYTMDLGVVSFASQFKRTKAEYCCYSQPADRLLIEIQGEFQVPLSLVPDQAFSIRSLVVCVWKMSILVHCSNLRLLVSR